MRKTILINVISIIVFLFCISFAVAEIKYFDANGKIISESEFREIKKQRNNVIQKSIPDNAINKSEPVKTSVESNKDKEKQEETIRLQKEAEERFKNRQENIKFQKEEEESIKKQKEERKRNEAKLKENQDARCYQLGFKFGKCGTQTLKGIKCNPEDDIGLLAVSSG